MEHYIDLIHSKGSTDGFNTELSEWLHIDCAKQGYRASNKKNYTKQMVHYLTLHEALDHFMLFLVWTQAIEEVDDMENDDEQDKDDKEPKQQNMNLLEHDKDEDNVPVLSYPSQSWCIAKSPLWPRKPTSKIITDCPSIIYLPSLQRLTNETTREIIRATPQYQNIQNQHTLIPSSYMSIKLQTKSAQKVIVLLVSMSSSVSLLGSTAMTP
ncbi:hypothetical protein M422DRAFT_249291 [Sphaerobolus stellatus SS14]|uniref:Uncharacterized protein n=1 Tax=Sphaerobolus stellatus (strain SS14) TaxID=990650 RepID=A0A0C9VI76_SPHS4|nr:hypothetical protein M422DRAFT_249291 [Sphaerobolus stellatus SS14]